MENDHKGGLGGCARREKHHVNKGKKTQGFTMKGEVGKQYPMVQSIR